MAEVKALIDGGKATAGAPLGPALGPLGLNIGQIVAEINEKTKAFAGMKVPVTLQINEKTKEYTIEVGSPPTSALILKEVGVEKGASAVKEGPCGNIDLQKLVDIAKAKIDNVNAYTVKNATLQMVGSCISMGATINDKGPKEVTAEIKAGTHDALFA